MYIIIIYIIVAPKDAFDLMVRLGLMFGKHSIDWVKYSVRNKES